MVRLTAGVLRACLLGGVLSLAALPLGAGAQEIQAGDEARADALRVFLDCSGGRGGGVCDSRHFRTEITYVNWVRDRRDAEVHVMITSERTGSGGQEVRFDFYGLEALEGVNDSLFYTTAQSDTRDEELVGVTSVLAVGLARYSTMAGYRRPVQVTPVEMEPGPGDLPPGLQGEVEDPWNYWVFRVGGNGGYEGEERESSQNLRGSLSADRTTEMWKVNIRASGSYSKRTVELTDTTTFLDERRDWEVGSYVLYSLADRWSIGALAEAAEVTRYNQDLTATTGVGIEYSFFPYREATRRRLTVTALLGAEYFNYEEETVYYKMEETLAKASLEGTLNLRQPWGGGSVRASASMYLHDTSKNRLSLGGGINFRIFRGLDWNLSGNIARVHDQLYLPLGDIPPEEILVQRRALATDWKYSINSGFSFSFGSIYNNVVNNRFF